MGEANVAVTQWLSDDRRFADLFNGVLFDGKEVVRPEDLEPLDREADVLVTDKRGKTKGVQRYRDVVKRWKKGAALAILACESQKKVHYAMPVRNMLYDSLSYAGQIREMWKQRSGGKEEGPSFLTQEEYLSRFRKGDRICPVITIVFYYDLREWDGATDLYEMFQIEETEVWRKFLPNYRINLVDAGNVQDLKVFRSDLQQIFGMLKCRGRGEELLKYIEENRQYFEKVDRETYEALKVLLHSRKMLKDIGETESGKEEINMCQALKEIYADGVREGRESGERAGKRTEIFSVVKHMVGNGFSPEDIERYTGISGKEIRQAMETLQEA